MIALNSNPNSSTPKQRKCLHQLKRQHGWSDEQLHEAIGAESTTLLSAKQASEHIRRLGGGELPNPPGEKPAPFAGKRKATYATRKIMPDHEEQIERMLGVYFPNKAAGLAWLEKDFDAKCPHDLLTAKRAGQVIHVLRKMIQRRKPEPVAGSGGCSEGETNNAKDV